MAQDATLAARRLCTRKPPHRGSGRGHGHYLTRGNDVDQSTCPQCGKVCADRRAMFIHHKRIHGVSLVRPPCSVDGCTEPVVAGSYCSTHYAYDRRHGYPVFVRPPERLCDVPGCIGKHDAHGYCGPHAQMFRRCGDPLAGNPTRAQRWMAKVDMDGPLHHDPSRGPCWRWTSTTSRSGYGAFSVDGSTVAAYKWGYEFIVGEVPDGLQLDHTCHDWRVCEGGPGCPHRSCVNPSHLEVVTPQENWRRSNNLMAVNARKTHCIRGHEFTPENTYTTARGRRSCRRCMADASARYRAKNRSADL